MTEITSIWAFDDPEFQAAGSMVAVYSLEAKAFVSVPQLYRFDLFSPEDKMTWVGQFDTREEAEAEMREIGTPGCWVIMMTDYTGDLGVIGEGIYQVGEASP